MVNKESPVYKESYYPVKIGQGIYTSELPSNIPDGFSAKAFNLVATGDSLENRIGIRQSSVDYHFPIAGRLVDDTCIFARSSGQAALVWSSWDGVTSKLSLIRDINVAGAGDGYMEVTIPQRCRGIANYNKTIFFLMNDASRIYRIDTYNWVTDSITYTSIPSATSIPNSTGLLSFKDRLWTLVANKIYFTEIATLGGNPEAWAVTNFIPFDANKGFADVQKLVPLGNKLLVFTSAGVFSVLVEGQPSSWIVKVLDSQSISTSRQCAFEAQGIVYYVNTQGVFATNGISVANLSGVIEDQFFLAKGTRYHTIHHYENGMLLSISKFGSNSAYDSANSKIFYSKMDPVGWTDWNIDKGDGTENGFGNNRLVEVHSVSPKIPTFLNAEPTAYVLVSISDADEANAHGTRTQLLVFDGGQDQLRTRAGDLITEQLNCVLKTKYMDAGNPYRIKINKRALLEMFTSDTEHKFSTSWDIDYTVGLSSEVRRKATQEFTVGTASNLIQLNADFMFRRCALILSTALQTNTSQIKIKDLALVISEGREETEIVR